uniref:Zinc finger protein 271-like isoform X2 n=1 Tax=Petromyzon marinus TaxID=7757 RepID=A0AAJ7TIE6_PETMA|nr:zinc finger protein 271-like isoform X2 [Petromyzon marinus]
MASALAVDSCVDFSAWLKAQGVNAEVARAMDSELGIRDYGVLRACVGDGHVRAELLAAARDRLPFGFYAVLRRVVHSLHLPEAEGPRSETALGDLLDVLVVLFGGLGRELLLSAQKLGELDGGRTTPQAARLKSTTMEDNRGEVDERELSSNINCAEFGNFEPPTSAQDFEAPDWTNPAAGEDDALTSPMDCANANHLWNRIKLEQVEAVSSYESLRAMGAEKPFPCEACGRSFASPADLKKHAVVHASGRWPHLCDACGKCFSKASHLTRHRRTHTGERPYECDLCGKAFSQVPNLKRHRRTHGGEPPVAACADYDGGFSPSPQLVAHRRLKHGKGGTPSPPLPSASYGDGSRED